MKDIIVVGYPKSGNTWVTRLVAELAGCPVTGFWGSSHYELATEGQDRKSELQCYKSHHHYKELRSTSINAQKIIHIVREPRDITISGAHYFHLIRSALLNKLCYGLAVSTIL